MIIDTIEGCKIRLEDGPEGEKVTVVADADIDADGANGQNDARAAYMADDSGSEALANGGMGIRHGEVVGIADWFKDIVVIENGKPKIFPGGIIVSKTAYHVRGEQEDTPKRYVDSATVPYVVACVNRSSSCVWDMLNISGTVGGMFFLSLEALKRFQVFE